MSRQLLRRLRSFTRIWKRSRDGRDLLAGLPTLLMLVLVMQVVSFICWNTDSVSVVDRYLEAARVSVAQREWAGADLKYRKVLQEAPNHATAVYELAKVATVLRQRARRDSLLDRLESMEVDPKIPLWVAELRGETAVTPDGFAAAITALEEAHSRGLDTAAQRVRLATRCFEYGIYESVVVLLESEESLSSSGALILAKSWQALQKPQKARAVAREMLLSGVEHPTRVGEVLRAQCYVILGDFERAIALLERGSVSPEVECLLVEVYVSWLRELGDRGGAASSAQLVSLQRGLVRSHADRSMLNQFLRFSQTVSRESLDLAFRDVSSPLLVHLTLGLRGVFADDPAAAQFHLDLAQRMDGVGSDILLACLEHPSMESHRGMLSAYVREGSDQSLTSTSSR